MASKIAAVPAWRLAMAKWAYNWSYFPQLGLWRDDTLLRTPEVLEAINRLPKDVYDQRIFRQSRALLLSNSKQILPREEWTKFEDDKRYLKALVEEVAQEEAEKIEWAKK